MALVLLGAGEPLPVAVRGAPEVIRDLPLVWSHSSGGRVMRIDRLTATSCIMPCIPSPPPPPTPTPKPFNGYEAADNYPLESERQDQRAIVLAKATSIAASLVATAGDDYAWTAETTDAFGSIFLTQMAKGKYQTNPFIPPVSLDDVKAWKEPAA